MVLIMPWTGIPVGGSSMLFGCGHKRDARFTQCHVDLYVVRSPKLSMPTTPMASAFRRVVALNAFTRLLLTSPSGTDMGFPSSVLGWSRVSAIALTETSATRCDDEPSLRLTVNRSYV